MDDSSGIFQSETGLYLICREFDGINHPQRGRFLSEISSETKKQTNPLIEGSIDPGFYSS